MTSPSSGQSYYWGFNNPPLLPKTKTFLPKHYPSYHNILYLCSLRNNRPIPISVSFDSCRTIIKQLLDDNATVVGRLVFRKKKINPLSDKNNSPKRRELFIAINKNKYLMSAYYDLYETPSPDGKEDKKSLHARICPKGLIPKRSLWNILQLSNICPRM